MLTLDRDGPSGWSRKDAGQRMGWAEQIGMGTDGQDEIGKMLDARCKVADRMDGQDGIKKWG